MVAEVTLDPATLLALVTSLADLAQQAALPLNADQPTEEEQEDHEAYAQRLKSLVTLRAEVPVDVVVRVVAAIEEADRLPWNAAWYSGKTATAVFGLMRIATTNRDAAQHMAESVVTLANLGLHEAAWFKASDTVFFAARYFDTTLAMAKMANA